MGMYNMKDEEILKKAIEKAVKSGYWKEQNNWNDLSKDSTRLEICKSWLSDEKYLQIIFSRSFAKSFWGEKEVLSYNDVGGMDDEYMPAYLFYLQQMVLEEDKLKYLEKFLK